MPLHKGLSKAGFKLPSCEKHFHDHDETWLILAGKGTGYWIDHGGKREEFELEAGDVWMIPAGYEHGSEGFTGTGRNSDDFTICVFNGTQPEGSHVPGHYYIEKERYVPILELKKIPTDRYSQPLELPTTMRGIVFPEKGCAVLADEPTPGCPAGTVLCKSLYTGLTNGTERNVLMGGNYGGTWPNRVGYQNVGRVLAVGVGVRGIRPGDVIFSGDFCCHRQYFDAPAGPDSLLATVPESIDPRHAALLGVASVAVHDIRRAEVKFGENALVVGAGPVGQFTAQLARLAGANVTICDLDEERLAIAKSLGANSAIALTTDADSWQRVKAAGPFDVVFEDSGAPILDRIIGVKWPDGILRYRSRVVMIAGRSRVDYAFNTAQNYELTVYHAGHFLRDDLNHACRLAAGGQLQMGPIVRDVIDAESAPAIYDTLRDNPSHLFGVVFDWTQGGGTA